MAHELDNIDRGILHLLQVDARNATAQEIADKVGTSASTVRNRIERLEKNDVIAGYHPELDYEAANLPLRVLFVVTAPPTERSEYVEELLDIKGVIDVREMLTGRRNVHVRHHPHHGCDSRVGPRNRTVGDDETAPNPAVRSFPL
ncbi:Lrp/AsnC family transcriptional regulator [Halorarum salinum]|uniref:Lrp/AsnC family transcriptional regulator n=1 Tax=Halorarum salinum TaxID=2743089 RepID=UPI001C52D0C6|nr:AsnC family transcriptional regulator [Halobaculum salinum]